MMIMTSNQSSVWTGYLAGAYPGSVGHLFSPGGEVKAGAAAPYPFVPYALDNGAYGAHLAKAPFNTAAWRALLNWAALSGYPPMWLAVPDVVGDRTATLAAWSVHSDDARRFGWPLAFVVQDGMAASDVPREAEVVFVGGGMDWKLETLPRWCREFPHRVHVGRINTLPLLYQCLRAGVASVDGTGWFHTKQMRDLVRFVRETREARAA